MTSKLHMGLIHGRMLQPASIALLALACTACGMNLRPQPSAQEQSIAGQWQLNAPQHDAMVATLRTAFEQAQGKQEKRNKRRGPQGGPGGPGEMGGSGEGEPEAPDAAGAPGPDGPAPRRDNWQVREQREQQEALINAVVPSNKIQINQGSSRIELVPETGARRRFDMGLNSTLVSNYATLLIESGWQKNIFVIHSRDANEGIDIIERFQRQGAGLHVQVELKVSQLKKQVLDADYVMVP
ncbi:MAG: hypothetical protein QM808_05600 [Steroidobacteraceae bacterium]